MAGIVAAAGAFSILMAVRPANAQQLATLKVLSGSVSVSVQGAAVAAATDGMSVKAGDVVETGDPGRAVVRYFDGSETRLDSNTRFEVRELHTLPNKAQSKVIRGKQTKGATFNRIVKLTDSQSRVQTEAPTSTASVRGTAYSGTSNADGTFTWRVFEGAIKVTDSFGKSVIVKAGQGVIVDEDGRLLEVYDLSDEELQAEWVTFNNCKLDGMGCPQVLDDKQTGGPGTPTDEPQGPQGPQ
ncbi:MAG TPA: FecR domain-containing protein, partial [Actinomycetota bacterium]|nr:FecR domain-containing protein [Actinomycetota bacterium]